LLSDNTGCGVVMLRPIRFLVVAVWIADGLPCIPRVIYIYIYIYIYVARQKVV
jgi:hypothetical protein